MARIEGQSDVIMRITVKGAEEIEDLLTRLGEQLDRYQALTDKTQIEETVNNLYDKLTSLELEIEEE